MAGYVEAAEAYFRSPVQRSTLDELAARYRQLEVMAVLLAWDAETATGRPRVPNGTVADACRAYPDVFTGLGSVDPHKGEAAVAEVAQIAAAGLRGVKFHPSLQAFAPDDHGLLAGLRRMPGARPDRPLPHRDQRDRGRPARRSGHQAGLRTADQARPGRRRASRSDHRGRALRLALAHGTDRDRAAQDQRLHRHLRLVAAPDTAGGDRRAAGKAVRPVPLGQRLPVPDSGAVPGGVRRSRTSPRCGGEECSAATRPASSASADRGSPTTDRPGGAAGPARRRVSPARVPRRRPRQPRPAWPESQRRVPAHSWSGTGRRWRTPG